MSATLCAKQNLAVEWSWDKLRVAAATLPNGVHCELQLSVVRHEGLVTSYKSWKSLLRCICLFNDWLRMIRHLPSEACGGVPSAAWMLAFSTLYLSFSTCTYHFFISVPMFRSFQIKDGQVKCTSYNLCWLGAKLPVSPPSRGPTFASASHSFSEP
jgi:hypothetical protein